MPRLFLKGGGGTIGEVEHDWWRGLGAHPYLSPSASGSRSHAALRLSRGSGTTLPSQACRRIFRSERSDRSLRPMVPAPVSRPRFPPPSDFCGALVLSSVGLDCFFCSRGPGLFFVFSWAWTIFRVYYFWAYTSFDWWLYLLVSSRLFLLASALVHYLLTVSSPVGGGDFAFASDRRRRRWRRSVPFVLSRRR